MYLSHSLCLSHCFPFSLWLIPRLSQPFRACFWSASPSGQAYFLSCSLSISLFSFLYLLPLLSLFFFHFLFASTHFYSHSCVVSLWCALSIPQCKLLFTCCDSYVIVVCLLTLKTQVYFSEYSLMQQDADFHMSVLKVYFIFCWMCSSLNVCTLQPTGSSKEHGLKQSTE